jgi:hypothetical protein
MKYKDIIKVNLKTIIRLWSKSSLKNGEILKFIRRKFYFTNFIQNIQSLCCFTQTFSQNTQGILSWKLAIRMSNISISWAFFG